MNDAWTPVAPTAALFVERLVDPLKKKIGPGAERKIKSSSIVCSIGFRYFFLCTY